MVYIQDFASTPNRNFGGHDIIFRSFDTGERIKGVESSSPLPIPRKGEYVLLTECELTLEGSPAWGDDQEYPDSDDLTYRVEAIEHEYVMIEPDEAAEKGYENGQGVITDVFVAEVESDLPL